MNNSKEDGSQQEGSIEKFGLFKSVENPNFESIPPFIRSKIEMTVQKAIQQKKIFSLGKATYYRTIKDTFLRRGWIQKTGYEEALWSKKNKRPEDLEELYCQSLLRAAPVTILWTRYISDWNTIDPKTIVNRFPILKGKEHFCSKIGLNNNLQDAYWFHEDGVSAVKFPRTYNLQNPAELKSFIDDYVITACISLLKIIIRDKIEPTESYNLFQIGGKIPLDVIYYAIKKCDEYITFREHGDLDEDPTSRAVSPSTDDLLKLYDYYLSNYSRIVEQKDSFTISTAQEMKDLYNACRLILQSLPKFIPQVDSDGYRNLWLVKDSDSSCGKGVWVLRKLSDVLGRGKTSVKGKTSRYIVQKYIERPLLIYNTKFDIRQWFLVTRINPLQIWMYRKSYLRFSSQPFSLDDTHEAVHLCNNSIQRKYPVHPERHPALPRNNMWDSTTFRRYLKFIGQEEKWAKVIYPSMKASIIAALQVSQDDIVDRPNSFELYGADFILTEDFSPWLIEINSSPAMHASTSVTGKLCSQCYKDVIKVVIDYNKSQQANTGDFELIYKQSIFYKQLSPEWNFPNIYTYGTQLKLIKKQNQIEPLPIMNALKMKKWRNLELDSTDLEDVQKKLLRQQRKNFMRAEDKASFNILAVESKNTSTENIKYGKHTSNFNGRRINNEPDENLKKTFLRSSQKIKYITLPKITTVNRTYFQVMERNNTINILEQQLEPENKDPLLRMPSGTNLAGLRMDFIEMTVEDFNKDNNPPMQDFKPHERKSRRVYDNQALLLIDDYEKPLNSLGINRQNAQNRTNFLPEGSQVENSSLIDANDTRRFCKEDTEIYLSQDNSKTSTSKESGGNVDSNINLYHLQINSFDKRFNDRIESIETDKMCITNNYHSHCEETYTNLLDDIYGSTHYEALEDQQSDSLIRDRLFYRTLHHNEQQLISNGIDRKCLLNIYLTMKKDNDNLYETSNDRSFVEIESANNVLNYIFYIHPSNRLDNEINDNPPIMREDSSSFIQEPDENCTINASLQIEGSMNYNERIDKLLEYDVSTILEEKNDQRTLQPQECSIQRHSNTNLCNFETIEFENQGPTDKSAVKNSKENICTGKGSNKILPYKRTALQNNYSRLFSACLLIFISAVLFLGYILLFHDNLSSLDWIYSYLETFKSITD
ncbi:uncharacterized protein LOC111049631 isoform X2 [Nilaparvata lugens]|uniref:uncharacterized protein LOC111049631 isoform X2 n=1 Tax=Nilaparvata lugens TaxID=108931 RepID=UPI00193D995C|nr:uncharacterized protein LOC111049631 isoform X2 [Nilaparvata lugens]